MAVQGKTHVEPGPHCGGGEEAGHVAQEVSYEGEGHLPVQWAWGAKTYS